MAVVVRRLEVSGAQCGPWPRSRLSTKGDRVQCLRSGADAVSLQLETDDAAGTVRKLLSPLAQVDVPAEPRQERRLSEPKSEVIGLSRSRDYSLRQLSSGCPTCKLYSADIDPSDPNAEILRATWTFTFAVQPLNFCVIGISERWSRAPLNRRCTESTSSIRSSTVVIVIVENACRANP
jgi:hypothetical protein